MSLKTELLAVAFGMLLILLNFGDNHIAWQIGNLDTIFGHYWWPMLDMSYPIASIGIFLLYGKVKGGLRLNTLTVAAFTTFLAVTVLVSIDDFTKVLGFSSLAEYFSDYSSRPYWLVMLCVYPILSYVAFLIFGLANQEKTSTLEHGTPP